MVDVGTGLTSLGSAEVSKDLILKILGPTAEYIGEGVQVWTARRVANVQRMLKFAYERLGARIDEGGTVPPRVLKAVLEEAQVAQDELMAEYLGGVLASSRSEVARDDRAAATAATIGRLSTYAVRAHYVMYAAARPLFRGVDFRSGNERRNAPVFVAVQDFSVAMGFSPEEDAEFNDIFAELMLSLTREDLVQEQWAIGDIEGLGGLANVAVPAPGIVYRLSNPGIILFCAAHGLRLDAVGRYAGSQAFPQVSGVQIPQTTLAQTLPPFPVPDHPPGASRITD